ncbi:MAG: CapA family protein [Brevinematales bacterium]|nr:CapA family protein [Brevinematales bacterium]
MRVVIFFNLILLILANIAIGNDTIIVKAVGDTMLGSVTPKTILPPRQGEEFVESIGDYLKGADIVLANLEGAFIKDGFRPSKCGGKKNSCYEFGMPTYLTNAFKKLGFNVVSFNNNHVMDYGRDGYNYTLHLIEKLGMKYADMENYAVMNVKGKQVCIVAFGFSGGKYSILDVPKAKQTITSLKEKYDIVIVSFHGGAEGNSAIHTKDINEYFLGSNRGNVVKFARGVIDAGADLVIGHGPHVLRAIEIYKGKLIAYSLGNFLTYGNFNIKGNGGIGGILEVHLTAKGEFIKANFIPTIQIPPGIPVYDREKRGISLINRLGKEDFPQSYYKFE